MSFGKPYTSAFTYERPSVPSLSHVIASVKYRQLYPPFSPSKKQSMSLYQQPAYSGGSYGQAGAYPSTSTQHYNAYQPPLPPPQAYQPPPTPNDVQIFRQWFSTELSRLVENNRAIIHRLAYICREHVQRFAPIIAQCMEQHIRRVSVYFSSGPMSMP